MIEGLDKSHWTKINWEDKWSEGLRFAFLKVTEGTDFEDNTWREEYDKAKDVGFLLGPYHWLSPDKNGIVQADWMANKIATTEWDLPWALDVEEESSISKSTYAARVKACLNQMEIYHDLRPIVYTSAYKWNKFVDVYVPNDLWAAHWTTRPQPYLPRTWNTWKFWQYAEKPFDQDRFNGTHDELLAYINRTPDGIIGRVETLEKSVEQLDIWAGSYRGGT